jgi:hypothetical protein
LQVLAAIVLGGLLAASAFFVAKGLGAIFRKRWREGWVGLLGLALFAAYIILIGAAAYLFIPADLWAITDPTSKARILAEHISVLMNRSAWGAPLGLLLALVFLIRGWRASRIIR